MIHVTEQEAISHRGEGYDGLFYPTIDEKVGFGTLNVNGRTPKNGYHLNEICKIVIYVLEGEGKVHIKGQDPKHLSKGTFILIDEGDLYVLEGDFKAAISCAPCWSEEQHRYIDDAEAKEHPRAETPEVTIIERIGKYFQY